MIVNSLTVRSENGIPHLPLLREDKLRKLTNRIKAAETLLDTQQFRDVGSAARTLVENNLNTWKNRIYQDALYKLHSETAQLVDIVHLHEETIATLTNESNSESSLSLNEENKKIAINTINKLNEMTQFANNLRDELKQVKDTNNNLRSQLKRTREVYENSNERNSSNKKENKRSHTIPSDNLNRSDNDPLHLQLQLKQANAHKNELLQGYLSASQKCDTQKVLIDQLKSEIQRLKTQEPDVTGYNADLDSL